MFYTNYHFHQITYTFGEIISENQIGSNILEKCLYCKKYKIKIHFIKSNTFFVTLKI